MTNIVDTVFGFSSRIKNGRTLQSIAAHGRGELAELDAEIEAVDKGEEEGEDGIIGEAVDVIACMLDIIWMANPNISSDEINELMTKKCQKWERKYS